MSADAIGAQLGIATNTVNQHIFSARRKLGSVGRWQAADALRAFEKGQKQLSSYEVGIANDPPADHTEAGPDEAVSAVHEAPSTFEVETALVVDRSRPLTWSQRLYDLADQKTVSQTLIDIAKLTSLIIIIVTLAVSAGQGVEEFAKHFQH